jgi:hypothetical protein
MAADPADSGPIQNDSGFSQGLGVIRTPFWPGEFGQRVTRSQRAAGIIAVDRRPSGGGDRAAAGQATVGGPAAKAKGQVDA